MIFGGARREIGPVVKQKKSGKNPIETRNRHRMVDRFLPVAILENVRATNKAQTKETKERKGEPTMSKKTTKKSLASVSSAFARAVGRVLATKCKGPDSASAEDVAATLHKSGEFGISNLQLLKLMVSQAVSEGSVQGYASMTGRPPSGGIFNIAQREAWNAKVDAKG